MTRLLLIFALLLSSCYTVLVPEEKGWELFPKRVHAWDNSAARGK